MLNIIDKVIALAACFLGMALFTPLGGLNLSFESALYIHIGSFLVLGLFYELPEFLLDVYSIALMKYLRKIDSRILRIRRIILIRFFVTHIVGPISGVMAVASGLYLIHVKQHSFLEGWLFWMVPVAAIFVWKGFFHHNLYTRTLFYMVMDKDAIDSYELRRGICSSFDVVLNLLELPGYLFIFFTDYFKPLWPIPCAEILQKIQTQLPSNALLGVGIFLAVFLFFTPTLIWSIKKWSVCKW